MKDNADANAPELVPSEDEDEVEKPVRIIHSLYSGGQRRLPEGSRERSRVPADEAVAPKLRGSEESSGDKPPGTEDPTDMGEVCPPPPPRPHEVRRIRRGTRFAEHHCGCSEPGCEEHSGIELPVPVNETKVAWHEQCGDGIIDTFKLPKMTFTKPVSMLKEIVVPGISGVSYQEWEEVILSVDSGASETVAHCRWLK